MWARVALTIAVTVRLSGSAMAADAVTSKQMDEVLEELRKIHVLLATAAPLQAHGRRMGISEASRKGIDATPTFVIGRITSSGVDGELAVEAAPLGIFQRKFVAAIQ